MNKNKNKTAFVVALGVSMGAIGLASPAASAKTINPDACFGQNTSIAVSQYGVSLKEEAARWEPDPFPSVGAMLQYFRSELPFGCPGD